jgi:ankyrin repeat protein
MHTDTFAGTSTIYQLLCVKLVNRIGRFPTTAPIQTDNNKLIRLEEVSQLLNNGADINALDSRHRSGAAIAVENEFLHLLNLLLKKGIDVNVGEMTPLHCACKKEQMSVVETLVKHGANINACGAAQTPLSLLCENATLEAIESFIDLYQPDVNLGKPTPLEVAYNRRDYSYSLVLLLLR